MPRSCPIDIRTVTPSSIPLVTMLCRIAGISNIVNQMVAWNDTNSRISPGLLIETLVISILCGRRPLWKVHQFWAAQDMTTLLPGVDISWDQPQNHLHSWQKRTPPKRGRTPGHNHLSCQLHGRRSKSGVLRTPVTYGSDLCADCQGKRP